MTDQPNEAALAPEASLEAAAQYARSYIAERSQRDVHPTPEAVAELTQFEEPMPTNPTDAGDVIDMLHQIGSPGTVQSNGPRYFGFVTGGAMPVARASAALASAWDQNGALATMSPTAATLDGVAIGWIQELLDLPNRSTGVFCGGASEANLIGLITARDSVLRRVGFDVQADGLFQAPEVNVVISAEAHVSLIKALGLAGLGRNRVTVVGTDNQGRIKQSELEKISISEGPGILCLQAGNVNTGQSDDFESAIAWATERQMWTHIDGAFGLWAAASDRRKHLVAGQQLANSWALDCHKWLNVPYDAAVAFVADGQNLRRSMAAAAAYLGESSGRAPMHLGLQMSQKARAIDTWAVLKHLGRVGVAELIDSSCDLAAQFGSKLEAGGVEILHDVVLNQVMARFGDDETTDAVVAAVQSEGTCWVGPTTWHGLRAMRISVSGSETTELDVEASVSAILRVWETLAD